MSALKAPTPGGRPPPGEATQLRAQINWGRHPDIGERYVSRRELRTLLPVSDMTIWRWMRDPEVAFPRPVKLGRNGRNFWWLPAILDWQRRRAANCGGPPEVTP